MHNIKDLRNNIEGFTKLIKTRNSNVDINKIIELDKKNRSLIQQKELTICLTTDETTSTKFSKIYNKYIVYDNWNNFVKNKEKIVICNEFITKLGGNGGKRNNSK